MKKQTINGNCNQQAGRDLIVEESLKINFFEGDLVEVIDVFTEVFPKESESDFDILRINIETKNKKNHLSDDYFKYMNDEFLPHFDKVDQFLKDQNNDNYLVKYKDTCKNINTYIKANRKKREHFEEFFPLLTESILMKKKVKSSQHEFLFNLMFHYMYWNCDIGDKT